MDPLLLPEGPRCSSCGHLLSESEIDYVPNWPNGPDGSREMIRVGYTCRCGHQGAL